MSEKKQQKAVGAKLVDCEEMQQQLSAYMLRELGDKQSRLVHEHLRICEVCRKEASRFEKMHALLLEQQHTVDGDEAVLSEKRMRRLRFTAMHPLFDWIYFQHRMVSALCAVLLILLIGFLLRNFALFREPDLEDSIPIWRMFRSGRLPELVEEVHRRVPEEP